MAVGNKSKGESVKSRIYFFDGLRGWAALTVLVHHIVLTFPELGFLRNTPLRPFIDGTYAVYIFFVLSGVVLSIGYFSSNDTRILSELAIKRIPRLSIPILVSSIILVPLMKCGLFFNIKAAELEGGNAWLGSFYTFTGSFIRAVKFSVRDVFFHYNGINSYNSSLWTMPGEVSGSYLVVILLLLYKYLSKNNLLWGLLFIYVWFIDGILFSFMLGILVSNIYVMHKNKITSMRFGKSIFLAGFIGAYFCSFLFSHFGSMYFWIGRLQQLMYSISAFSFVLLIVITKPLQIFFSMRISRFLGKLSFPLYIVHIPIICTFTSYLIVHYWYAGNNIRLIALVGLTIVLSMIAAYIFYPIEKISIKISGEICKYALHGSRRRIA